MKQRLILLSLCIGLICYACSPVQQYAKKAKEEWKADIQAFDSLNRWEDPPGHSILFTGSSSIRLWDNIHEDMEPYPVIQRGYGGAKLSDFSVFTKQIVYPHEFRAIAIFVANDITGTDDDRTPKEVGEIFQYIVETIRKKKKTEPIFCIEITPTSSRWNVWDEIIQSNLELKKVCEAQENVHFIETASYFLNEDGKPKDELFIEDKLHLNKEGYKIWTKIIKSKFEEIIPSDDY